MYSPIRTLKSSKGTAKYGTKTDVFSKTLCKKIRKRLNLTTKQLSDTTIYKTVNIGNSEIAKWVIDNAEGTFIHQSKRMGMLCVSKQLPKEFREDNEDKIAKIQSLPVSELLRKQMLKHYNIKIGDKLDKMALFHLHERVPLFNLATFYYTYRLIWFNHRNCKLKKASVYRLQPTRPIMCAIYENVIVNNKMYFEHQFHDFYHYRIHPEI